MSEKPKYSVIIPIYNAEKTLRRCLDSILKQNYRDIEIILVNDGSSDGSGAICREYAERLDSIVYIDKPNGGVSTARNAGLNAATGKYVLFVDSDDYVSDQYFATLNRLCEDRDYDCVMFSHNIVGEKTVSSRILTSFASQSAEECVSRFCQALYQKDINHPINKRYSRQIIEDNRIRFPEQLYIGEDKVFCLEYAMHCQSCLIASDSLYNVNIENPDSLSRKIRPDWYEQFAILDRKIQQVILETPMPEVHRRQYIAAENLIQLRSVYSEAKRMHLAGRDRKFRRKIIRQKCRSNNAQKAALPGGMFSRLLRIPVRLNMVTVIDLLGWYLAR